MTRRSGSLYRAYGKRALDLGLALPAALATLPVLAALALAVRLALGPPALFRQRRPGLDGRPFELFKLRTMADLRDERGRPLPDERRLTSLGAFLRRTSLDELPGLWNVLRGEMSLVGPRPLLMRYLDRYTERQARRHRMRPGLTGWAQVNGRNALTWEAKFEHDLHYVDRVSLGLDLKILALTVWKVITGEGVSAEGSATMPEFMGSKSEAGGETPHAG